MYLYLSLFSWMVIGCLTKSRLFKIATICLLIVFVGLRFRIGADWNNYDIMFNIISSRDIGTALSFTDPAYGYLNYLATQLGYEIWFVNLICAILFFFGLHYFCKNTKNYWIALLVAFPYLILAVSMGFTRQSVAIGLSMLAMTHLFKDNKYYYLLWMFVALLFHKSALLLLLFTPYAFDIRLTPLKNSLYFLVFMLALFFIMNKFSSQDNLYFTNEVSSAGALARMIIHLPAVGFYVIFRDKFKVIYDKKLLVLDTFLGLIILFFFISFVYSTFADRFNLYLYIFDMIVLSAITQFFNRSNYYVYLGGVILFEFILTFVWLNYSPWAQCCWIPYQNYLWID